jgi:ribosomal protein L5
LTTSRRANILLKIRKGHPVGCALVLERHIYVQLFSNFDGGFPTLKDFKGISGSKRLEKNKFLVYIKDLIAFNELGKHFYLFNNRL